MLSLIAGLVLRQATFQRLDLPNGASVVVERVAKQPLVSIQIFASSRYAPDSNLTHGYRHLLEHLIARGVSGHADTPLEAVGGILRARTFRDTSQFEVTVTPDHLEEGFAALGDVLGKRHFTQAEIDRETQTIREESALNDVASALGSAGWSTAFGEQGLDPLGNLEVIAKATPEDMEALRDAIFRGPCVCLTISGDLNVDILKRGANLLTSLSSGTLVPDVRKSGKPGRSEPPLLGEARCVPVPPFDRPSTAATMAAALAIAAQLDDCFVSYTPSMQRGLVTLGRVGQTSGVSSFIDSLRREGAVPLYGLGKRLAARWYRSQRTTPSSSAALYGMLISEDPSADPSQFMTQLNSMSLEDFVEATRKFTEKSAVTVVGVGR